MSAHRTGNQIAGHELLASWEDAKARGLTQPQHARELGLGISTYQSRMFRAKSNALIGTIPDSRHRLWTDPPELVGDALILGDPQFPYHNAPFINRCVKLAKAWEIDRVILGGDALEANSFSSFKGDFEPDDKKIMSANLREELEVLANTMKGKDREKLLEKLQEVESREGSITEEIKEVRILLKALSDNFQEVLWIMGNHEARIIHALEQSLPPEMISRLFMADNPSWKLSPYYWCRLTSNGVPYQIEHPKNSGKGSSKRLASKYGMNVIMLHGHHYCDQTDPSGKWRAVEPGACVDKYRLTYEQQRHGTADEHVTGACIVRNGYLWLLNDFTDWEMLEKMRQDAV